MTKKHSTFLIISLFLCSLEYGISSEKQESYFSYGPIALNYRKTPPKPIDPPPVEEIDSSTKESDSQHPDPSEVAGNHEESQSGISEAPKNEEPNLTKEDNNPLLDNLKKYENYSITSIWDAPKIQENQGESTNANNKSTIELPTPLIQDLLSGSYFGQVNPETETHPDWEQFGNHILNELENISSRLADRERPFLIERTAPFPYGFLSPGEIWIPANSSVTYTVEGQNEDLNKQ